MVAASAADQRLTSDQNKEELLASLIRSAGLLSTKFTGSKAEGNRKFSTGFCFYCWLQQREVEVLSLHVLSFLVLFSIIKVKVTVYKHELGTGRVGLNRYRKHRNHEPTTWNEAEQNRIAKRLIDFNFPCAERFTACNL